MQYLRQSSVVLVLVSMTLASGCGEDDSTDEAGSGPQATGSERAGGEERGAANGTQLAETRITEAQATAIVDSFYLGNGEGLVAAVESGYNAAVELSDDDYANMACTPPPGTASPSAVEGNDRGSACIDWPCEFMDECWGEEMKNDDAKCDDYGSETHMGTGLTCFCKCADNGDWSSHVRACLHCAHKAGVNGYESHACCYARASLDYSSPKFTLAKCYVQCAF